MISCLGSVVPPVITKASVLLVIVFANYVCTSPLIVSEELALILFEKCAKLGTCEWLEVQDCEH